MAGLTVPSIFPDFWVMEGNWDRSAHIRSCQTDWLGSSKFESTIPNSKSTKRQMLADPTIGAKVTSRVSHWAWGLRTNTVFIPSVISFHSSAKWTGSPHKWTYHLQVSLVAQAVKNLPAMLETWVWSLDWEDTLEMGLLTHSSILAWRIPWTEEPETGGLQFMGLQTVRQFDFHHLH